MTVSDELLAQVQDAAAAEGRTVDELVSESLKRYLKYRETGRELAALGKWGREHARRRGFKPSDVPRTIAELRRRR